MLRLTFWTVFALVFAIPASANEIIDGPQKNYAIGTGFLISADGLVLTNLHVVSRCADLPEVGYVVSGRSRATVIAQGRVLDLALLKTGFRDVPYLRLRAEDGRQTDKSLPIVDELIHTVGFIEGEFTPRGGYVLQSSDPELLDVPGQPLFSNGGSVVSLHIGSGASGSPILDNTGLLIGIIWAINPADDWKVHILNSLALDAFLTVHGVPVPAADIGPHPLPPPPRTVEGALEHIGQIVGLLAGTTVKITCPLK